MPKATRQPSCAALRGGTLAPERRASDRPMAMACLRLVTFFPLPLFSLPRLNSRISRSTLFCALGPYLRRLDDFFWLDELDLARDELDLLRDDPFLCAGI